MAHTKVHRRKQAQEKRRKNLLQIGSKNQKRTQDTKIKRLTNKLKRKDKRGKDVGLKKQLANIPVQERSAPVNKKARGLSSLGKNYKQQELDLAKKATKRSAEINKARYPKMGTYKSPDKSTTDNKGSKTNVKKGKSSIEARNRARLGDARVDHLKAKQVDFKKMRKGGMSKSDFIKKYPKSITAQRSKGLRK
tara:strand:+ start:31 stop:609 length:579 start_codon:yes stop_codon:yes gene_type:complete